MGNMGLYPCWQLILNPEKSVEKRNKKEAQHT